MEEKNNIIKVRRKVRNNSRKKRPVNIEKSTDNPTGEDENKKVLATPSTSKVDTSKRHDNQTQQATVSRGPGERGQAAARNKEVDEQRNRAQHQKIVWLLTYFNNKPDDYIIFDRNMICILDKIDKIRPNAIFMCKLCKYYCDHVGIVASHIFKDVHKNIIQDYKDKTTLEHAPPLSYGQLKLLNSLMVDILSHKGINKLEREARYNIYSHVQEVISTYLTDCSITLFGPSVHGMGLRDSDVTMDLKVPDKSSASFFLEKVKPALENSEYISDVQENFDNESPYVSFYYSSQRLQRRRCTISLFNEQAIDLSCLLAKYASVDERLPQLASFFCLWAEVSKLNMDHGIPTSAFAVLTIFYLQHNSNPILPILNQFLEKDAKGGVASNHQLLKSEDLTPQVMIWRKSNGSKHNLSFLWNDMLHFYTVRAPINQVEILIDESDIVHRNSKKLFISDPFMPSRNMLRNVAGVVLDYMMKCLYITCKYFIIPHTSYGPLFKDIYVMNRQSHGSLLKILEIHDKINTSLVEQIIRRDSMFNEHDTVGALDYMDLKEIFRLCNEHRFTNVDNIPVHYLECGLDPPRHLYKDMQVSRSQAVKLTSSCNPKFLEYKFIKANFTGKLAVPNVCAVCRNEGHATEHCPAATMPHLNSLEWIDESILTSLTEISNIVFDKWRQTEKEIETREVVCAELESYIRGIYPTARLVLFGSSKNGFGLRGSDMDICLTFEDDPSGETVDIRGFIEQLCESLRECKTVHNLLPIVTAKVPIVKFSHMTSKLDGDISLYNVLAMENSRLLNTYSQIDPRVQVLGIMMKRFSKVCCIGDASKGGLSSYAFTLLVIYYLQQCNPPVIPVLQELPNGEGPLPVHLIEGCNAYFYDDIAKLKDTWPGWRKNGSTVGRLWLNLLVFYTEQFDFLKNVVCIRRTRSLSKFEKLWVSKGIAIEDPFALDHNLGAGLSRRMALYILKAFIKGRNHFTGQLPVSGILLGDLEQYYFNMVKLTDGDPPNDRGCKICGSGAHKEKLCPYRKQRRTRPKKRREKVNKMGAGHDEAKTSINVENSASDSSDEEADQPLQQNTPEKRTYKKLETPRQVNVNSVVTNVEQNSPEKRTYKQVEPPRQVNSVVMNVNSRMAGTSTEHPRGAISNFKTKLPPPGFTHQDAYIGSSLYKTPPNTTHQFVNVPQSLNNESSKHIPTIVFNNSKLAPDVAMHPPHAPPRPPPGFIPISSNGPRYGIPPLPHEYLQALAMYSSPVLTPRPPVRPPFSDVHFVMHQPQGASMHPPPIPSSPRLWNAPPAPPRSQPILIPHANMSVASAPVKTDQDSYCVDEVNCNNNACSRN